MAGKGLALGRTPGNGALLADDHDLSSGAVSELDHSIKQSAKTSSLAHTSLRAVIADVEKLCQSAEEGNFEIRADETKHGGDYREIVQSMNRTLDVVVDKLNLYKTIVDSVPFPIQVIDKDMNWVFLNKAFEKLMVDENFIKSRNEAPGKPCSTAAAAICKTQNCGIVQLKQRGWRNLLRLAWAELQAGHLKTCKRQGRACRLYRSRAGFDIDCPQQRLHRLRS